MEVLHVDSDTPENDRPRQNRVPARRFGAVLALLLVGGGVFGARAWYGGGTQLIMDGGIRLGVAPHPIGTPVNFGVVLETGGGPSVILQSARATHSANVELHFGIVRTGPGELGIGDSIGPLTGTMPLRGFRVSQPATPAVRTTCTTAGPTTSPQCSPPPPGRDLGATFLVVTVVPTRPGPWTVTQVSLAYRSWSRSRTATSSYVVTGAAT